MWFLCDYSGLSSWEMNKQSRHTYLSFWAVPNSESRQTLPLFHMGWSLPTGLWHRVYLKCLRPQQELFSNSTCSSSLSQLHLNSSRGDLNPCLWQESPCTPLCLFNFVFGHFDFVFVDIVFALRQILCIPGWPLTCYVVESVLGLLILLLPCLQCWDCKHATQLIPLCLLSELRGAALLAAFPSDKGLQLEFMVPCETPHLGTVLQNVMANFLETEKRGPL